MRTTLFMLCILGASLAGSAQDKSFDLSKYKFPDYKRHELQFSFVSAGNSSSWSSINITNPDGTGETIDYKNAYSNSNINLGYSFFNNTRKRQESIYSSFSGSYYFSKLSNDLGIRTHGSPNVNFQINASEKYYLTENKWFMEVDPGFLSEASSSLDKYPASDDLKQRSYYYYAHIGLGGGIGRMENVTEFWQAYYILESLNKQGSLLREPSETDIYELATLASQLKSKRFFDSRLKKMDEMKSIDSLMHKTNLIDKSDISYFNTLNDYWSFATISSRSSGRILKLLMTPSFSHSYNKELGQLKRTYNETYLNSEIDLRCSKQLNLYWERNFMLNVSNMTTIDKDVILIYKYPKNFQRIYSNIGWNYYPNFRTQLRASLSYQASQFAGEVNEAGTELKKEWSNNVGLNSSIYYYLSPQLRIEANVGVNYYDKQSYYNSQTDKLDINYNLGFHYAIF